MKVFRWDNEKNEMLKKNRGVSFEQVVILMERADVLDTIEDPNQERYPGQKIAVINIDDMPISFPMLSAVRNYSSRQSFPAGRLQTST